MSTLQKVQTWLIALRAERKRVGVWLLSSRDLRVNLTSSLTAELGLTHIDLTGELLPKLTDAAPKPLGVFTPDDLIAWLHNEAYDSPSPIIVEGIESLLATFPKPRAQEFFRLAAELSVRSPVVLATYLVPLVQASGFPLDRTLSLTE